MHKDKIAELLKKLFERDDLTVDDVLNWKNGLFLFLDLGSGNSSAAKIRSNQGRFSKPEMIFLNRNKDKKVYSLVVCAADKEPIIGITAERADEYPLISDFKTSPTDGNLEVDVEGTDIPHGKAMQDFVNGLIRDICSCNQDIDKALKEGSLYLIAAHPSGGWSIKNFRRIFQQASGLDDKHIFTINESRAAIQYAKNRKRLTFDKGLLIIDLGAYSVDVTYVHAGKRESWDATIALGGRRIEENLLDMILKKVNLTRKDIQDLPRTLQKLRRVKERNYVGGIEALREQARTIFFPGNMSEPVTEEMVHEAVSGVEFWNVQADGPAKKQTWAEHLKTFINFCTSYLQDKGLPIESVLVTGGASAMTEAFDVISGIFPKKVERIDAPAKDDVHEVSMNQSVPIGSALHFTQSYRVISEMLKFLNKIRDFVKENLPGIIAEKCAQPIIDSAWENAVLPVVKKWVDSPVDGTLNQLCDNINSKIKEASVNAKLNQALQPPVKEACEEALLKIRPIMEEFYRGIYGANWPDSVKINDNNIQDALTQRMNSKIADLIPPQALIDALDGIGPVIAGIIITVIILALVWMFWYVVLGFGILSEIWNALISSGRWLRKQFMSDEEVAQYEAELEAEAFEKAKAEAEKREQERKEKMREPQSKSTRERVLKHIQKPTSQAKKEAVVKIKSALIPAISGESEKADFFGIPDIVVAGLTKEIENAIYVG